MLKPRKKRSKMIIGFTNDGKASREKKVKTGKFSHCAIGVLFATAVMISVGSVRAEDGEDGVVAQTREGSPQETYLNFLRENTELKKEKDRMAEEISKLQNQNSGLLGRNRDLENRMQSLSVRLEETEKLLEEERKNPGKDPGKDLEILRSELEFERTKYEYIERKLSKEDYVRRYNDARKQLEGTRRALSDMTKESSQDSANMEKTMMEIVKENEHIKLNMGKAHFNLGTLFFKAGDYEKAAYEYEQAAKVMPNDPETCYNLAIIYDFYVDEPEKSKNYYERYFRAEPDPGRKKQLKERMAEKKLMSIMNAHQVE
jgi:tetratricopeptide (TPR) repeat protein